jgi:hypothetical protein
MEIESVAGWQPALHVLIQWEKGPELGFSESMELVSSDNGDGVCLVKACWGSKGERECTKVQSDDLN